MSHTPTAHIHLDGEGVAWIDDTNVKVVEYLPLQQSRFCPADCRKLAL